MEVFVRVVDARSFSAAARQLGIGQPAVSKTVAQLEDRLDVRLLLRSTRGLTPTESGEKFYEHAKRSIEEADEADLAARGAGAALCGRLRICAPVTFARLHIVPRLATFLTEHPDLEVEIILDDRKVDLMEAGCDIAFRMGDLADSALTARKIGQNRRLVVATPAYLDAGGKPHAPADLVGHQAIIYDHGGSVWTFRKGADETAVTLKGRVRVTAAEGLREAVLSGLGFAIASAWTFAPELSNGTVRPVLQDWTLPPIELWAMFPTGRRASAKARAFAGFIEEQLFT
jgi:DNA-binding transcriptional LysR family regulator